MQFPTIHLNGTSGDALLEQYKKACAALMDAMRAASDACPNGRDYYPQGDQAISLAAQEHANRIARLCTVHDELSQIVEHILDDLEQIEERKKGRAR